VKAVGSSQAAGCQRHVTLAQGLADATAGYGEPIQREPIDSVYRKAALVTHLAQERDVALAPIAQSKVRTHPQLYHPYAFDQPIYKLRGPRSSQARREGLDDDQVEI
jgi:hypothetical protein